MPQGVLHAGVTPITQRNADFDVTRTRNGGRCASVMNDAGCKIPCTASPHYTHKVPVPTKGAPFGRTGRSHSVPPPRKKRVIPPHEQHDPLKGFTGLTRGFPRERGWISDSMWSTLPKGTQEVQALKAALRGGGQNLLATLTPGAAGPESLGFVVPPAHQYKAADDNLRIIMLGDQPETRKARPPVHPGTVLPGILSTSQSLFGIAMNKAGTPLALRCIAGAVPPQAPKYMVHDTKSCTSSAYSNFNKTWVYNDDRRGSRHWRSEYKGRYDDKWTEDDDEDLGAIGTARDSVETKMAQAVIKAKLEGKATGITAHRAMAQKPTVKKLFRMIDTDNSGAIDDMEFCALCKTLQIQKDPVQTRKLFLQMDRDRNGKIDFEEVWKWYTSSWSHLFTGGAGN